VSNPKLDEIFRYQQAINDLSEHKLGLLINKRWGQIRVQISYTLESQREHFFELDLNQAYWYVCDMADGLGIGPLGKANRND
jgi:hypothetical protein